MTHLDIRKWRYKNIKLHVIMIEDGETCNMLTNSNCFGACLNCYIARGLLKYGKS